MNDSVPPKQEISNMRAVTENVIGGLGTTTMSAANDSRLWIASKSNVCLRYFTMSHFEEELYGIKFCFEHKKTGTETITMLRKAHGYNNGQNVWFIAGTSSSAKAARTPMTCVTVTFWPKCEEIEGLNNSLGTSDTYMCRKNA